jgi:hypothetical protein
MLTYEQQLEQDSEWALHERQKYFAEQSAVHKTTRRFVDHLKRLGIDYAVAGDLCMFFHGFRRFTKIVEVLVTPEGMDQIHRHLFGHGYVRPSASENYIRDAENGVCIKFLISGQSP